MWQLFEAVYHAIFEQDLTYKIIGQAHVYCLHKPDLPTCMFIIHVCRQCCTHVHVKTILYSFKIIFPNLKAPMKFRRRSQVNKIYYDS